MECTGVSGDLLVQLCQVQGVGLCGWREAGGVGQGLRRDCGGGIKKSLLRTGKHPGSSLASVHWVTLSRLFSFPHFRFILCEMNVDMRLCSP